MTGRNLSILLLISFAGLITSCQTAHDPFDRPWYGAVIPETVTSPDMLSPHVILTNYHLAYRCSILIDDMKLPFQILPKRPVPFSHEASGTIFVGYNFPFQDFKEIMTFARNYYQGTRYIELSDPSDSSQKDSLHYAMILGAETERGMIRGLDVWSESDFKRIRSISSQEEMRQLIRSKMQAPVIQIEDVKELSTETDEEPEKEDPEDILKEIPDSQDQSPDK